MAVPIPKTTFKITPVTINALGANLANTIIAAERMNAITIIKANKMIVFVFNVKVFPEP